jgi:hypothetical protein
LLCAQDATKQTLYPLKEGNKWTYTTGKDKETIEVTVKGKEKVGTDEAYELVTSRNGTVEATEQVVVKTEKGQVGVYRVKVGGVTVTPPLCFLKIPARKGDKYEKVDPWEVSSFLGPMGGEKIEGKFTLSETEIEVKVKDKKEPEKKKAFKVSGEDMKANGQNLSLAYWFVENIGLVRQEATLAGVKVKLELSDYTLAK